MTAFDTKTLFFNQVIQQVFEVLVFEGGKLLDWIVNITDYLDFCQLYDMKVHV